MTVHVSQHRSVLFCSSQQLKMQQPNVLARRVQALVSPLSADYMHEM